MSKTLYDVLELSRLASAEAIDAAHKRLSAKYALDLPENATNTEAQNSIKAVAEAHRVLSDPEKKTRYDIYLASKDELPAEPEPVTFWTPAKLAAIAMLFIVASLGYYNFHLSALERTRQIAAIEREKQEAATEAERMRVEEEEIQKARQDQDIQFHQDRIQKAQTEQARREGQQIIQQQIAAEQRAKMESQRMAQQAAMAAERQSMVERQKYEAQRRQDEYQRQMEQARLNRLTEQQRYLDTRQGYQNRPSPNDLKLKMMQAN